MFARVPSSRLNYLVLSNSVTELRYVEYVNLNDEGEGEFQVSELNIY